MQRKIAVLAALVLISSMVYAQDFDGTESFAAEPENFDSGFGDDFDFGFDEGFSGSSASASVVAISGEIEAAFLGYAHDFSSGKKAKAASLGDMVSGMLNFSIADPKANVTAYIGFNLSVDSFIDLANISSANAAHTPLILDEAYLQAFFGPVNITAGYKKLFWGRADSLGPLDIINPLDYSDLTEISDLNKLKIARPLLNINWYINDTTKLEAVFIPNFAGHRFTMNEGDRWAPAQFSDIAKKVKNNITDEIMRFLAANPAYSAVAPVLPSLTENFSGYMPPFPDTSSLEYFQAGLRFATSIGSIDIGGQYFYGNLFQPGFTMGSPEKFVADLIPGLASSLSGGSSDPYTGNLSLLPTKINYTRYHQIGIDYAQVLFGFTIRAEAAIHLTEDMAGTDGSVANPFVGWSLGFDRDIVWGINFNFQCNETVRLFHKKLGKNPIMDFEAGTDPTATRLTMRVAKSFLKDNLETAVTALWDIEKSDCYIIPAINWTIKEVKAELSAGIFAGKESGDLGQYWENSFVKIGLTYSF